MIFYAIVMLHATPSKLKSVSWATIGEFMNKEDFFDDYGIVFSGGGARGAWQIGVLEALLESRLLTKPAKSVAGTSVGALNAVLYAQEPDSVVRAKEIWQNASSATSLPKVLQQVDIKIQGLFLCWQGIRLLKGGAVCNDCGLRELIDRGLQNKLRIPTSVCAYNKTEKKARYNNLFKEESLEVCRQWLLASTAIPLIFPSVKIGNDDYSDGGFGWDIWFRGNSPGVKEMDNLPIGEVQETKKIILLILSKSELVNEEKIGDQQLIYPVFPSEDLGNPLDFTRKHIDKLLALGKKDGEAFVERFRNNNFQCLLKYQNLNDAVWSKISEFYELEKILEKYPGPRYNESIKAGYEYIDRVQKWLDENREKYTVSQELQDISTRNDIIYNHKDADFTSLERSRERKIREELPAKDHEVIERLVEAIRQAEANNQKNNIKQSLMSLRIIIRRCEDLLKKYKNPVFYPGWSLDKEFSGRDSELEILRENIKQNPGKAVLLWGFVGNGKRTLAKLYAIRNKEFFPGGILYAVNSDESPLRSLSEVIVSLFEENIRLRLEISEDSVPKEYLRKVKFICEQIKHRVSGRKLLLIFGIDAPADFFAESDNEAEQIVRDMLFNEEQFTVIVTSRERAVKDDSAGKLSLVQQNIRAMSRDDAVKLIRKKYKNISDENCEKIYKKTGGNPWAIKFAGEDFIKNWQTDDDDDDGESIDAQLNDSDVQNSAILKFLEKFRPYVDKLNNEQRDLLFYASLFPDEYVLLKWLQAFECSRCPERKKTKRILLELKRKAFFDEINKERYKWHPNIRKMVQRIGGIAVPEYAGKMCEFLINEWRCKIPDQDETVALAHVFCEWTTQPWKEKVLPLLFSLNLDDDLGDYLTEYQLFVLRDKACRAAADVVNNMKTSELRKKYTASLKIYQGHCVLNSDPEKAIEYYKESRSIREKVFGPDANETLLPVEYEALAYGKNGNYQQAEKLFRESFEKFNGFLQSAPDSEKVVARETLARWHNRYAEFLIDMGKDADVIERHLKKAVDLSESEGVYPGTIWNGRFLRSLGLFYKRNKQFSLAVECFNRSNRILKHYNHPFVKENEINLKEIADEHY